MSRQRHSIEYQRDGTQNTPKGCCEMKFKRFWVGAEKVNRRNPTQIQTQKKKKEKFRRDVIRKDNPSTEQRHTYKTGDRLEGKKKKCVT